MAVTAWNSFEEIKGNSEASTVGRGTREKMRGKASSDQSSQDLVGLPKDSGLYPKNNG